MKTVAGAAGRPSITEFIILVALIISLVALSIDAMLPALPSIAADLGVTRINDSQYVISIFFAGMALGQIVFGPMSDSLGRRPAIIAGFFLYALGCLLSLSAQDYSQMLLGVFYRVSAPPGRASLPSRWYATSTAAAKWRASGSMTFSPSYALTVRQARIATRSGQKR